MIKVAMLSKWHVHASEYARRVMQSGKAQITCVWDEDAVRGAQWAQELGVPFEQDLDALLARDDVEAVVVDTPTNMHHEVMMKAARAGKHIYTEKVMALTVAQCEDIAREVRAKDVKFCISYPQLSYPIYQYCKRSLGEGWMGNIHYMRFRNAHNGTLAGWLPEYWYDPKTAGGGAMMDLGAHPLYTAAYLLGKPKRIASMFTNQYSPTGVDDNAVCVVEFADHAIAVLETSFISPKDAGCFELLGTKGAISVIGGKVMKYCPDQGVEEWTEVDDLPEALPHPMDAWLAGIETGAPIFTGLELGIALSELVENAYLSDRAQEIVKIQ